MKVILDRFHDYFAWFSLRGAGAPFQNTWSIPYFALPALRKPARFPLLRLILNYFLLPYLYSKRAFRFARENGSEVVLADLAFEAVIGGRLAARFSRLPLLVNVHDDPVSRLRDKDYPIWFLHWYEKQFAKTLRNAQRVGVISDTMGEFYQQRYDVHTTTLYIGVEDEKCLPVRCPDPGKRPIIILSIGSIYSRENWNLLISVVRQLNNQSSEERFRILHIGSLNSDFAAPPEVEVTGWLPDEDFLRELDRADICFLNASFAPEHAEVGRLSFPLKIHSYIQAQRPMLALGPPESSVVRFVRANACGAVCEQADEALLAETILQMVSNPFACVQALQGLAELKVSFSRQTFLSTFEKFVRVND